MICLENIKASLHVHFTFAYHALPELCTASTGLRIWFRSVLFPATTCYYSRWQPFPTCHKKKERKKKRSTRIPDNNCLLLFPGACLLPAETSTSMGSRGRNKAEIISLHLQDLRPHQLSSQPLSHPYLSGMTFSFQLITRLKIKVIKNPQIHCFTLTTPPKGKHHILWVARQNQSDAFQCLI